MTVTEHKWLDPVCNEDGCQSLVLKGLYRSLISALAARSVQTCYSGDPERFVDAVINNLDEVDAILPDSCNRSLSERIRLLLERANREASLAVELRERAERAESALREARNKALDEAAEACVFSGDRIRIVALKDKS